METNKTIKHFLLYGGLSKEDFMAIAPDVIRENYNSLHMCSILATIVFVCLMIAAYLTRGMWETDLVEYAIMASIMAGIYVVLRIFANTYREIILPLTYGFMLALYMFSARISITHLDAPAVTFMVLLVCIPILFLDRPIRTLILLPSVSIFFCILTLLFKNVFLARVDVWNAVTFCVLGIAGEFYVSRIKFNSLVQTRKIKELSETDVLTMTKNRNKFEHDLYVYPQLAKKNIICVFVDVNGLHELNNSLGHEAGDVLLKSVAKELLEIFQEENTFRIGGDEFVGIALDAHNKGIEEALQRAMVSLQAKDYHISYGMAYQDKQTIDMHALTSLAEENMYAHKKAYYENLGRTLR